MFCPGAPPARAGTGSAAGRLRRQEEQAPRKEPCRPPYEMSHSLQSRYFDRTSYEFLRECKALIRKNTPRVFCFVGSGFSVPLRPAGFALPGFSPPASVSLPAPLQGIGERCPSSPATGILPARPASRGQRFCRRRNRCPPDRPVCPGLRPAPWKKRTKNCKIRPDFVYLYHVNPGKAGCRPELKFGQSFPGRRREIFDE